MGVDLATLWTFRSHCWRSNWSLFRVFLYRVRTSTHRSFLLNIWLNKWLLSFHNLILRFGWQIIFFVSFKIFKFFLNFILFIIRILLNKFSSHLIDFIMQNLFEKLLLSFSSCLNLINLRVNELIRIFYLSSVRWRWNQFRQICFGLLALLCTSCFHGWRSATLTRQVLLTLLFLLDLSFLWWALRLLWRIGASPLRLLNSPTGYFSDQ